APAIHAEAAPPAKSNELEMRLAKMQKLDGFLPLYWDETNGRLLMEVSRFGEELLYRESLAAGGGSNPIGLDRAEGGDGFIVRFDRVGPKVLMVAPNEHFRA